MKVFKILVVLVLTVSATIIAQETPVEEFKPSGKPSLKVFWNYHHDFSEGATQKNAFELQRAYFGYNYNFSKNISVKFTIDAAGKDDASAYTAFLKHAQLDWKVAKPLKLSMGLIDNKQFDTQEKFWGYRYLFKSFQDEFKLGSSADLGVNAEIALAKTLTANVFVLNGEGYTNLQDEMGRMKVGGNLLYKPIEEITLKAYYDIYTGKVLDSMDVAVDTSSIHTVALFAGYDAQKFRIAAGYEVQLGGTKFNEIAANHNIYGISVYGTYVINKQIEVFASWMNYRSSILEGDDKPWNKKQDGNYMLGGIQYAPVKGVKMALNYRYFLADVIGINDKQLLYLNFEYTF